MPIWKAAVPMVALPLVIVACFTVAGGLRVRRGETVRPADMARLMPWFAFVGFAVASLLAAWFVHDHGVPLSALRIGRSGVAAFVAALALGTAGAVLWSATVARLIYPRDRGCQSEDDDPSLRGIDRLHPGLLVTLAVSAGVCEEWVYRGVGLAVLEAEIGFAGACAVTSAVFGLAHAYQGPRAIVSTGLIGAVFAVAIVWPFSSLPAAMVAHAVWDLTMLFYVVPRQQS